MVTSVGRQTTPIESTAARLHLGPLSVSQRHHLQCIHLDALRIVTAVAGDD